MLSKRWWGRFTDEEAGASFEVVPLSALPSTDGLDLYPSERGACCYHCETDWRRITDAAVRWLESGSDPLDFEAIQRRAKEVGLDNREVEGLLRLFNPHVAIAWLGEADRLTNGRHRLHALRASGVERCVAYTGRGERHFGP